MTATVSARRTLQATADRLTRLQRLATALADVLDPETAGMIVVEQAQAALGATSCGVSLLDETGRGIETLAASGGARAVAGNPPRMALDAPFPAAQVIRTGEPLFLQSRVQDR